MIILGIDPGLAIVGWGVIEYNGSKMTTLGYGSIDTPAHTAVSASQDAFSPSVNAHSPNAAKSASVPP